MASILTLMMNVHHFFSGIPKMKKIPKTSSPVRFGILSAANINPLAILDPVESHPDAVVISIAARDINKAKDQAARYAVPEAYGSYDELLAESDIDAVYIPLPNGLHAEWAIKSMRAGKHVLVEKPIASNADEVRQIQACAEETGKIVLEAFHWQFHPACHVVKSIVDSGRYGNIISTGVELVVPTGSFPKGDIRFVYDGLAGGASMDLLYGHSATHFFVSEPEAQRSPAPLVLHAKARKYPGDARIDEAMTSTLLFQRAGGKPDIRSTIHVDFCGPKVGGIIPRIWKMPTVTIELDKATITFSNFVAPFLYHSIAIYNKETGVSHTQKHYSYGPKWGPRSEPWWSTYRYQLEAFIAKIRGEEPPHWVSLEESLDVMEIVDRVYDAAGMPKRGVKGVTVRAED